MGGTARAAIAILLAVGGGVALAEETPSEGGVLGLPLTGEDAIAFLLTAEVVGEPEEFDPVAITDPQRVSLTDGERTLRAIFKDVNTLYPRFRFGDGHEVNRVKDSYKHEIAAYELDVLLGLGIVPPCVERKLFSRKGSLCLWVEGAVTESERKRGGRTPPDPRQWNERMLVVFLFQQLIGDHDAANTRNRIVDENFKIYKVDSSVAFNSGPELLDEGALTRLSRQALEALESMKRSDLDERLSPWLSKVQRNYLWGRRDQILRLARERVARYGEDASLY